MTIQIFIIEKNSILARNSQNIKLLLNIMKIKLTCLYIVLGVLLSIYSCKDSTQLHPNTAPEAAFSYSPTAIDTSTVVNFDASQSTDAEDALIDLKFCWDFEGKQNWTDPSKSTSVNYMYKKSGTYKAQLKVEDTEGWSSITSQTIIVHDSL